MVQVSEIVMIYLVVRIWDFAGKVLRTACAKHVSTSVVSVLILPRQFDWTFEVTIMRY